MNACLASASMAFCCGGVFEKAFVPFGALCRLKPLSVVHVTEQ